MTDVLVLAAFHPELQPLRSSLGDAMRAIVGGVDVAARVVGIGLSAASVGAAMQIDEVRPSAVVLVGTCGAYAQSGLRVLDVVVARAVKLVDPAVLSGAAQFPDPMSIATETHAPMRDGIARESGARAVDVATTLAVTVDDAVAARIALATQAQVEHLEAFGVAAACTARGVPFGAVLAVANAVGARAREEWRVHHRGAAAAAAQRVLRWVGAGAPR